jgi:hypothetical protein
VIDVSWRIYLQKPDGSSPGYGRIMTLQTRAAQQRLDLEYMGHDPEGRGVYWTTRDPEVARAARKAWAHVVEDD